MDAILEAAGLTFAYPGREESLRDVSFRISRGERVALLGANGSGKTTLLYLLDGLYFPSAGEVRVFGDPLTERRLQDRAFGPRFRREVGLLFQNSEAQLFCPTVEEDVAFGPLQAGWPREEVARRVEEVLALLEIRELRKRPPGTLSAGEKKKAALASLLVLSPSVLLLDEPTTGLDPRSQSTLLELLEALRARGVTLLTATHDLAAVPHVADRALVLSPDHRLAADGPVEKILEDTRLLEKANLVHAHTHRHGTVVHRHPHLHSTPHHHHQEGE